MKTLITAALFITLSVAPAISQPYNWRQQEQPQQWEYYNQQHLLQQQEQTRIQQEQLDQMRQQQDWQQQQQSQRNNPFDAFLKGYNAGRNMGR